MTDPRLTELRKLYDQLPELACQGKCANSCGGIDMSKAEHDRIVELGYLIPHFTPELAARWQANEPVHCPALNRQTLRCDVYEDRPMICRLWGMSSDLEIMKCPHGCKPTRTLDMVELYEFLLASLRAGGGSAAKEAEFSEEELEHFIESLKDPEIAPLMARFIEGDRSAEAELTTAVRRNSAS